jgi:hypothetical protein
MVLREQPLCRENDGRPNRLARRTLLRRGFYSVLAGTLAAPLLPASRALAGTKVAKSDAEYKDSPRGSMRCDSCLQFQPPAGCKIVEGAISPAGSCDLWAPKPR